MPLGNFHERAVVQEQLQRAGQHLLLIGRLKMCRPVLRLGQQPVAVVNADLSACIDAVLPFPEFNQPCPVPIIKIHRKGIEHHLEPGSQVVVGPGIAGILLPGIHRGGKEPAAAVIHIAEGLRQLLHQGAFFALFHIPDSADNFLPAEMTEYHAEKRNQK